jgi:hypothetical protein
VDEVHADAREQEDAADARRGAPGEGQPPLLVLKRGFTFLRACVEVFDGSGVKLGTLRAKLFTIGGGFDVLSARASRSRR